MIRGAKKRIMDKVSMEVEASMLLALINASVTYAHFIENLQEIRDKLVNEKFICVAIEVNIAKVYNM